jgi:hypothetical protein
VAVFAAAGSDATPAGFADGVAGALWVSTALGVLAAVAGAALPRRRASSVPESHEETTRDPVAARSV